MNLINKIKNLIFPNSCLYCNKIINENASFCQKCWPKLQFISEIKCQICSYPLEFEGISTICAKCHQKKPYFDKNISIFRYNFLIKKVISNFKYRDQQFIAKKLAKILIKHSKLNFSEFDIISCVPTHTSQLKKRKYNPPALLMKHICKISKNNNYSVNLLIKTKNTKAQATLTRSKRLNNLKSAFKLNPKFQQNIKNKSILIIDDITTTSATLNEISKILKQQKVKKITTLTISKSF